MALPRRANTFKLVGLVVSAQSLFIAITAGIIAEFRVRGSVNQQSSIFCPHIRTYKHVCVIASNFNVSLCRGWILQFKQCFSLKVKKMKPDRNETLIKLVL